MFGLASPTGSIARSLSVNQWWPQENTTSSCSSCVVAGRTTSACAAESVMNCSSTTVKRSSRRIPSSTRPWSGAIDAGLAFQHTSALTGGSSSGSVSASAELGHVDRPHGPGPQVLAHERVGRQRGGRGGRDVGTAPALVSPGAHQRRQARDRAVGRRRALVALRADAEAQQRGLGLCELAAEPGDGVGVDPAGLRRSARRDDRPGAPAARRSRWCARGTTPRRPSRRPRPRASCRAPARRRCRAAGRTCSSATRAVRLRNGSTTTIRAPLRLASSSSRQRCGAVDIGFHPHSSR